MDVRGVLGMDIDTDDIGYGHTSEQVDAIRIHDVELTAGQRPSASGATACSTSGRRLTSRASSRS